MTIPFKVKLLTSTAKAPDQANEGDLWDIFADGFESPAFKNNEWILDEQATIYPQSRVLVRTGISLELPVQYDLYKKEISELGGGGRITRFLPIGSEWLYSEESIEKVILAYAVADLRPRSGLALKHGITVLNTPGTIDNSYRKEIGVILINHGHEPYTIKKGDKIAQMLIRPLYPSKMEIVSEIEDTGRGAYGSSGK